MEAPSSELSQTVVQQVRCASRICAVTVYARGALVTRRLELPAGGLPAAGQPLELVVDGVSPLAEPGSLRVDVQGSAEVLGVSSRLVVPEDGEVPGELLARLRALRLRQQRLEAERAEIVERRGLVGQVEPDIAMRPRNRFFDAAARVSDALAVVDLADGLRGELDARLSELEQRIGDLAREVAAAELEAEQARSSALAGSGHPTRTATVRLGAERAEVARIELTYAIAAARWWPVYTVRLDNESQTATLAVEAWVAQLSLEDWDDVEIALATADLHRDTALPELPTWRMGRAQPPVRSGYRAAPPDLEGLFGGYDAARRGLGAPRRKSARPIVVRVFEAGGARHHDVRSEHADLELGQSLDCDIVVDGHAIAARQARLSAQGSTLLLSDLGGQGTTLVNGLPLTQPRAVSPGDMIMLGSRFLHVGFEGQLPPAPVAGFGGAAGSSSSINLTQAGVLPTTEVTYTFDMLADEDGGASYNMPSMPPPPAGARMSPQSLPTQAMEMPMARKSGGGLLGGLARVAAAPVVAPVAAGMAAYELAKKSRSRREVAAPGYAEQAPYEAERGEAFGGDAFELAAIEPGEGWLDFDRLVITGGDADEARGRLQPRRSPAGRGPTAADAVARIDASAPPGDVRDPRLARGEFDHLYRGLAPVDIASAPSPARITLAGEVAPIRSRFRCVPVETPEVFREVELDNPFDAPLLAGPLDVFIGGAMVTTSVLEAVDRGGRIVFGLGVEERLRAARNPHVTEHKGGIFGGRIVIEHTVELELASALGHEAHVEVIDRVPVLGDEDDEVEVKLVESTPEAEPYDQAERGHPVRGGLRWQLVVPAGGRSQVRFRYDLSLSAKREIIGGNRRD